MAQIFDTIFDFFKSVGSLLVNFVEGIFNLGRTANDSFSLIALWNAYVPTTVSYYIVTGLSLTIVLVIIGRANK